MNAVTKMFALEAYLINLNTGESFQLVNEMKIGRSGCDINFSNSSSISGNHCVINIRGIQVFVTDLDSTNGTFINGQQIKSSILQVGDILKVGDAKFKLSETEHIALSEPQQGGSALVLGFAGFVKMCLFWFGVFIMPYFFAWFTLRKSFTKQDRIIAFAWLSVLLLFFIFVPEEEELRDKKLRVKKERAVRKLRR